MKGVPVYGVWVMASNCWMAENGIVWYTDDARVACAQALNQSAAYAEQQSVDDWRCMAAEMKEDGQPIFLEES